jgi:hypothetical protein
MGSRINEEKTKYVKISSVQVRRRLQNLTSGDFKFERVNYFTRPGSVVNSENDVRTDIHSKIVTANRAYAAHIKLFRSKLLSRNTEL